jgi:2-oxoglutarate ferredoxin oxidoreductase subunit gamma
MTERYEIRLSGEGGQGLVLAGKILAEAAAIYDDINATQSQSYGPEARGGASRSEVIIARGSIDYPKAENLDLLLALTQEALDTYVEDLRPEGLLVVDEDAVTRVPAGAWRVVRVPFARLARERLGRGIVANIVALGTIVALSGAVTRGAAEQAIRARVPRGTEEINGRAFRLGLEEGERAAAADRAAVSGRAAAGDQAAARDQAAAGDRAEARDRLVPAI